MRQGLSNAAASRIVGVNRKTGHRWRYGRSVTTRVGEVRTYPAITSPAPPVSARHLSEGERISIADGRIHGLSLRMIAAELGRAPSTISREIRRNRDVGSETYHPYRVGRRAAGRRVRPRRRKLGRDGELRTIVADHLEHRWSPEQVSTMLPALFPDRPEMRVAPETLTRSPTINAGDSVLFTVEDMPSGTYTFWCEVERHASIGMVGTLTVTP